MIQPEGGLLLRGVFQHKILEPEAARMAMYSFCYYFGFSVKGGGFIIADGFTNEVTGLAKTNQKSLLCHTPPTPPLPPYVTAVTVLYTKSFTM